MIKHIEKDPYYAVIFTAKFADNLKDYDKIANEMLELAKEQKGFISIESVKEGNKEITVSYWRTLEDIRNWSVNERHVEAKKGGKTKWYEYFTVRICKVEREYSFGEL
jgi:heme-degrading monooxygenase HmoA